MNISLHSNYVALPSSALNGTTTSDMSVGIFQTFQIDYLDNITSIGSLLTASNIECHGYMLINNISDVPSCYTKFVTELNSVNYLDLFSFTDDVVSGDNLFSFRYYSSSYLANSEHIGLKKYFSSDFLSSLYFVFGNGDIDYTQWLDYKNSQGYYAFDTNINVFPLLSSYGFYSDSAFNFNNVVFNLSNSVLKYFTNSGFLGFYFISDKVNTLQGLFSDISSLTSQVASLTSELENANQTIEDLNNQLTDMTNKYNDVKAQYEALSKSLNVTDSQEYKSLENQYEQVKSAYENLTNSYNDYKTKYNEKTYQNGYNAGQLDASGSAEVNLFSSLFLAIVGVPIEILNGFASFSIFNVSIISIALTFLFIGLILWVIKKFI